MRHWTILAALLNAAAAAIVDHVAEQPNGTPADNTAPAGDEPKRRGRPPGSTNTPKEPVTAPAADPAAQFNVNRELIKPLVEGGQGEDVKKVIAKYSKTGLKDIPAASQADFEKDIESLKY